MEMNRSAIRSVQRTDAAHSSEAGRTTDSTLESGHGGSEGPESRSRRSTSRDSRQGGHFQAPNGCPDRKSILPIFYRFLENECFDDTRRGSEPCHLAGQVDRE